MSVRAEVNRDESDSSNFGAFLAGGDVFVTFSDWCRLYEMNTAELLARYRDNGSEEAFGELVRRSADLVFSAAKRRLNSAALAEEAAQEVFVRLATKTPKLDTDHAVLGWLHRTTLHVSIDLVRAEARRRQREEKSMETAQSEDEPKWNEIVPFLDEALDRLKDEERAIVLLRFFERKAFAQVGAAFNISEEAAKMRTTRALGKLRELLATRNVYCTAVVLGGLLLNRAVKAAPPGFSGKVLSAVIPVCSTKKFGWVRDRSGGHFPWRNMVVGTASLLLIGLLLNSAYRRSPAAAEDENGSKPAAVSVPASTSVSRIPSERGAPTARRKFDPVTTRFVLTLRDSETGAPISGGRMHMAYFYAGGVGEAHKGVSDGDGEVPIPFPGREGNPGANIFVTADGYVPKILHCRGTFPETYEMKLDPALTFAGQVLDEEEEPVSNVRITIDCNAFEHDSRRAENVAFNSPETAALTDTAGAFRLPYVPREIPPARWGATDVRLTMSADGFEVTQTNFPVPIVARDDLKLVIRKGFVVIGRVVDPQGLPVANVPVRELHNFGVRKLRTQTDEDGWFTLDGVFYVPSENQVRVVVEPQGWACQEKTVRLDSRTNVVDFALVKSPVFRGRVLDEVGLPLADVTIRTDFDNQGIRKYEWLDVTNIDGFFEWASAPAEPTLFRFEKDGYEVIGDRVITPDGMEKRITLRHEPGARSDR